MKFLIEYCFCKIKLFHGIVDLWGYFIIVIIILTYVIIYLPT